MFLSTMIGSWASGRTVRVALVGFVSLLCGSIAAQEVVPDASGMDEDALTWTRGVSMGWNLGNSFESAAGEWDDATGTWKNVWIADRNKWETGWGNPVTTQAMLRTVRNVGFDAIRIPVRWQAHVINEETMEIDPVWMNRIQEVVDWCLELGFKVILNTHHELWLEYHPTYDRQTQNNAKLSAIWTQVATRFRDYDSRLAFAGVNEVQINWQAPTAENNAVMNSYNQTFVDAVRATGGRNYYRNLIVQTYSCNPSYGISGLELPSDVVDKRIAVEFHYYNPYNYCSGANGSFYYWGTAFQDKGAIAPETEVALRMLFSQVRKKWIDKGVGVVLGEYGVSCHYTEEGKDVQMQNMQYYMKCVTSEARKNGFAPFAWDNNAFGNGSEKYGIFDRNNNMAVRSGFLLNGIKEGSLTQFQESSDESDPEYVGDVFWEGNSELNWGDGLQLKIPASSFANFTTDGKLVVSFTQKPSAPYDSFQLCKGSDWSMCPFILFGSTFDGSFSPRSYMGTSDGSYTVTISFNASTLSGLKQTGLYLQGFGLYLTRVLLSPNGITGVSTITMPSLVSDKAYTVDGRRLPSISNTSRHQIYIRNGKKYVSHP